MNRLFEVAQKKESLASAFRKLTPRNLSLIPVVEDQRLVGIVTLQNLMHSMALARRKPQAPTGCIEFLITICLTRTLGFRPDIRSPAIDSTMG